MTEGDASSGPPEEQATAGQESTPDQAKKAQAGDEAAEESEVRPPLDFRVSHVSHSQIILAAGPVSMYSKQPLTVTAIADAELRAVSMAWVGHGSGEEPIPTAAEVTSLLSGDGPPLAVIAGLPGYGKRTTAVRALWRVSRARAAEGRSFTLKEVRPDWEDPAVPDTSLLPEEPQTGYLLDVASEVSAWSSPTTVANALLVHAEKLARVGSCLVVVADERSWPESASGAANRVLVRAKVRPPAREVAVAHLRYLYGNRHARPGYCR
ncbi:hypothetical protein AB0A69_06915 [Streptomyces sp. NPDC045431]|uniref:hypothetical protein n=1 Tax=Streptomyces sp. NPDC045431 TaxID=3155613 RepID=UPI003405BCCA